MMATRRFRTTVRLNEPVMREAQQAAATLNISVARLFELLLIDYVCHGTRMNDAPDAAPPRPSAKVIDLNGARQPERREST